MGIGLYQSGTYVRSGKTGETPLAYAKYVEGKYQLQKEKLRQEFSEGAIKERLVVTFLPKRCKSSLTEMQEFFYFLEDIKYDVIQKALTNFNFQDVTQITDDGEKIVLEANAALKKDAKISECIEKLQDLLDAMELILTQPLLQQNQKLYEEIQKIVTPEAINGVINQITFKSSSDDIKLIINQMMDSIMKNNGGLDLQKSYQGSEEARQQISTFIRVYLKKQIFQQYLGQAKIGVDIESSVFKGFIQGLIVNIKTMLGFFAQDELTKELHNQLQKILGKDWSAQVIGGQYNQSSHRSTSDIAFTKNGIVVKLPGISMKTFSANAKQVSHSLRVKNEETNLGKLIEPLSGPARNFIYNLLALAGTRVSGRGRKIYSNQEDTQEMYDLMHKMLVIRGLIGGMTQDDFAYYFVFNKKVYTIFEIVSDLLDNEGATAQLFGVRPSNVTFTPSRTQISKYNQWVGKEDARNENEAIQRSNAFKEYVDSNVKVGLTLRYNLLNL